MSVSDPIADMLTRIRNAIIAKHLSVTIPYSTIKEEVARILKEEGYVEGYQVVEEEGQWKMVTIQLKYAGVRRERRPVITGLKRVSKPGRRIYSRYTDIPWVLSGLGIAIISTPKGLMTGETARRQKVGGEILCYVW
jgi:small subunit ribosomal protein S8